MCIVHATNIRSLDTFACSSWQIAFALTFVQADDEFTEP